MRQANVLAQNVSLAFLLAFCNRLPGRFIPQFPVFKDEIHIIPDRFFDPLLCLFHCCEVTVADGVDRSPPHAVAIARDRGP